MKKPLDKLQITQPFGANPAYYAKFGYKGHEGVDLKTRSIGNSWGIWYDLMGWRNVYAVCNGTVLVKYDLDNYGTHIYLTDAAGNQYLYAHLKNARCGTGQKVKEGDVIAISGKTGNVTGPHLHFGYRPKGFDKNNGYGGFVDPMQLFQNPMQPLPKVPLNIARIGANWGLGDDFKREVGNYSNNKITLVLNDYSMNLGGPRMMTQDEAYALVDLVKPKEKFVFIFYTPIPGAAYYYFTSYSYPKGDCCITTCPSADPRALAFELSHQLQKFYNEHRGANPPVDVVDEPGPSGPTDEMIRQKYDSVVAFYQ